MTLHKSLVLLLSPLVHHAVSPPSQPDELDAVTKALVTEADVT